MISFVSVVYIFYFKAFKQRHDDEISQNTVPFKRIMSAVQAELFFLALVLWGPVSAADPFSEPSCRQIRSVFAVLKRLRARFCSDAGPQRSCPRTDLERTGGSGTRWTSARCLCAVARSVKLTAPRTSRPETPS